MPPNRKHAPGLAIEWVDIDTAHIPVTPDFPPADMHNVLKHLADTYPNYYCTRPIWKMKDGTIICIEDMGDDHLMNSIRMMHRNAWKMFVKKENPQKDYVSSGKFNKAAWHEYVSSRGAKKFNQLLDEAEKKRSLDIEFINRTSYNEMIVNKILSGEEKTKKVKLKINAAKRRKKFEKKKVGIHKKIW